MPNTPEVDQSLLYLRLESFLSAHWGLATLLRPRAPAHHSPPHLEPSRAELADYVWITFADQRAPRAVGIRVHRCVPGAPRYEVAEWTRPGELSRSLWRYGRTGGWQQLNVPGFPHDAALQGC